MVDRICYVARRRGEQQGAMCTFFGRARVGAGRRRLVQKHFRKPTLLHGGLSAQHASRFCFTSSPRMHVASGDTPHQPEHNLVRVIPYINSPFFTNGIGL